MLGAALYRLFTVLLTARLIALSLPPPSATCTAWAAGATCTLLVLSVLSATARVTASGRWVSGLARPAWRRHASALLLVLACVSASVWEIGARPRLDVLRPRLEALAGERLWCVVGRERLDADDRGPRTRVRLIAATPGCLAVAAPVHATLRGVPVGVGETWIVRARLEPRSGRRNPAGFDAAASAWRRDRVVGSLLTAGPWAGERVGERPSRRAPCGTGWRSAVRARVERGRSGPALGLALAMTFGERSALALEVTRTFQDVGWAHLLAVSGLHVGFVLLIGTGCLGLLGRRRPTWSLLPLLGVYALLTGAPPSVLRATSMASVWILARRRGRALSGTRALTAAATAMLTAAPELMTDVGALLSFSAVAGILVFAPRLAPARGRGAWAILARLLLLPVGVSIAAQLGTLPVMGATLHSVHPCAGLGAPIAIPLAGLVVLGTLAGACLLPVAPAAGELLIDGALLIGDGLIAVASWLASHGPRPWPVPAPPVATVVLFLISAAVIALAARLTRATLAWRLGAGVVAALSAVAILAPDRAPRDIETVVIEVLDVGHGDSSLVLGYGAPQLALFRARRPLVAVLIDTGDRQGDTDRGRTVVVPRLRSLGVTTLDAVVLTHADRDHTGGWASVVRAAGVRALWVPPGFGSAAAGAPLHPDTVRRTGTAGDTVLTRGPLVIRLLHPRSGFDGSDNDRSLVCAIEAWSTRALWTGDIERDGEVALSAELARDRDGERFDILKVAHHGSTTSSTPSFLARVQPHVAVVSAGRRFGLPAESVIGRLEAVGAAIKRTDRDGAVLIELAPVGYRVRTLLHAAR